MKKAEVLDMLMEMQGNLFMRDYENYKDTDQYLEINWAKTDVIREMRKRIEALAE